jgi:hypothetical protein
MEKRTKIIIGVVLVAALIGGVIYYRRKNPSVADPSDLTDEQKAEQLLNGGKAGRGVNLKSPSGSVSTSSTGVAPVVVEGGLEAMQTALGNIRATYMTLKLRKTSGYCAKLYASKPALQEECSKNLDAQMAKLKAMFNDLASQIKAQGGVVSISIN